MIVLVAVAILAPALACYVALRAFAGGARGIGAPLAAALALGLGNGLASWTYFTALIVTGSHIWACRLDAACWFTALVAAARAVWRPAVAIDQSPRMEVPQSGARWAGYVAVASLVATAALVVVTLWWGWQAYPHGNWDAAAIWNLRARAIWRGAPDWSSILSPDIGWSHPYYPLMLPLSVVRLWAYGGRETLAAPQLVALLFLVASAGTVTAALSELRGWQTGFVGGLALLAPIILVDMVIGQDADVPLGFFVVAALTLLALAQRAGHPRTPILIAVGVATGLAAWTKDEGVLLLVLIPVLNTVFTRTSSKSAAIGRLAAGAAPIVATLVWFKLWMASPSYLVAQQTSTIVSRLGDLNRLHYILGQMATRISGWGPGLVSAVPALGVAIVLVARFDRAGARRAALGLALTLGVLGGDALAYLITPLDVAWQIATSFDRLFLQLWPALVWGAFQLAGSETPIRADAPPERVG